MQLIQEYDTDWSFTDPSITPDIQDMFYEAMDAREMGDKEPPRA